MDRKSKLYYISWGDGIFAIYVQNGTNDTMYYIRKDYLGSYETITDDKGVLQERLSFDPWVGRFLSPDIIVQATQYSPTQAHL